MYRSSNNRVFCNNIDYCVRGYSHGVYNRGQDSAGILIYEQSNKNTFAFNSVTHGGDGFFLWAGQTTMDTGKGGCNDNLIAYNDFSHAPTNGIEATFSRNKFIGNLVMECWHGVWGGFSYDSVFRDNVFAMNAEGIAVEHGPNNKISRNWFLGDRVGIHLWENSTIDPNWGYGKTRDCHSHDTLVTQNKFIGTGNAIHLKRTVSSTISNNNFHLSHQNVLKEEEQSGALFLSNTVNVAGTKPTEHFSYDPSNNYLFTGKPVSLVLSIDSNGVEIDTPGKPYEKRWDEARKKWTQIIINEEARSLAQSLGMKGNYFPTPLFSENRGRRNILVDEWGPYDFMSPKLVLRKKISERDTTTLTFAILRSTKNYVIKTSPIAKVTKSPSGFVVTVPDKDYPALEVLAASGNESLKWVNSEVATNWIVKFFAWEPSEDPRINPTVFDAVLKKPPLAEATVNRLKYASNGPFQPSLPSDHFATIAETEIEVPSGSYRFGLTSDDGCRVWLDGKLVVDEWHYQAPTHFERDWKLVAGRHRIVIHHFEIDGYATLSATIRKK